MTRALLAMALAIAFAATANARREPSPEEALALAVAKVCVNEAGFNSAADCALIWQATRSHGTTARSRLAWLRAHSSCVLTSRPMSEREVARNCRWSRNLMASDAMPRGWPETVSWRGHAAHWNRLREWARRVVADNGEPALGWPCPEDPDTWGGREIDHEQALRRGFTPVQCVGTLNEGYRW